MIRDPMALPPLHITFSDSAAAHLQEALSKAGRGDEVITLPDDLSVGPIAPPDIEARRSWIERTLGYDWEEFGADTDPFWRIALVPARRRIAWMTRRSACEYAGFLEFVWRLGDLPCEMVDMTDITVADRPGDGQSSSPRLALSLGLLRATEILDGNLLDRSEPISAERRLQYRSHWQRLRAENAPLRIATGDGHLVSAPLSHFDTDLLSQVTFHWQKAARVIAKTFDMFFDRELLQPNDWVLASRLRALAAAGLLESRGDLLQIRYSEVRLPAARQPGSLP